jgi:hypothetical protein
VLKLPETPVVHLTSEGDNSLALAMLAPEARATAHLKFVAQAGGQLRFTPHVQLEGQLPVDLASQDIEVSGLPYVNRLRSWIFGAFAALFAAIARPWFKRFLRPWLPTD